MLKDQPLKALHNDWCECYQMVVFEADDDSLFLAAE